MSVKRVNNYVNMGNSYDSSIVSDLIKYGKGCQPITLIGHLSNWTAADVSMIAKETATEILNQAMETSIPELIEKILEEKGINGKGIEKAYIENENLMILYTNGTIENLGRVVGRDGIGKVYIPHIDDDHVLSWTVEDKEGEIPKPVDLTDKDEWEPVEDSEVETDYVWEPME